MPTLPVSYTSASLMLQTLPAEQLGNLTQTELLFFAGEAESEINANIANCYDLPFTVDIPLLTTLATDIAVYKVLSRRAFSASRPPAGPFLDRYKEALAMMFRICEGNLPLLSAAGAIIPFTEAGNGAFSTTKNFIPTFWEGAESLQFVDQDKIQNEADRRGLTDR